MNKNKIIENLKWYPILTLSLVILLSLTFFLMQPFIKTKLFVLIPSQVFLRPWTLITSSFLHANAAHLMSNILGLIIFGIELEYMIGIERKYMIYTIIIAILAGDLGIIMTIPLSKSVLGFSGAVFGLFGLRCIEAPSFITLVFLVYYGGSQITGFLGGGGQIAYGAHLAGLGAGLLMAFYWKKIR